MTHPGWWVGILALATLAAWLLTLVGQRAGLSLRSERLYAATVAMAAAAWLASAMALGVLFRPLPMLLGAGTIVLGLPWWVHRRRRARVRVERTLAAWPEISRLGSPDTVQPR